MEQTVIVMTLFHVPLIAVMKIRISANMLIGVLLESNAMSLWMNVCLPAVTESLIRGKHAVNREHPVVIRLHIIVTRIIVGVPDLYPVPVLGVR
ncbi:MAG: hypothetical protein H6757_05035 [Candidatus Omnitrophica bacterium]|nr:hypothetical protein [Candidatus Omnitrophota bacterium]